MNDTKNIIYLDNNATTMVDKKVVEAMIPYFSNEFGNPSSIYELAHEAHNALENSREVSSSANVFNSSIKSSPFSSTVK